MKKLTSACLALFALAAVSAASEKDIEAALRYIPDDAAAILVLPDFEKAVDQTRAFIRSIGLTEDATIESLCEIMGMHASDVRTRGTLVMAMNAPGDAVAIVELADPKAWRERVAPEKTEDGCLTWKDDLGEHFGLQPGSFLIVSDSAAVAAAGRTEGKYLAKYKKQAAPVAEKQLAILHVNAEPLRPAATMFLDMIGFQLAMAPQQVGSQPAVMELMLNKARTWINESSACVLTLDASTDELDLVAHVLPEPDSSLEKMFARIKPPAGSLLRDLPDVRAPILIGYEWRTPPGEKPLSEEVMEAMLKQAETAEDADRELLKKAAELARKMTQGVYASNAALQLDDDGRLAVVANQFTDAVKEAYAAAKEYYSSNAMAAVMASSFGEDATVAFTQDTETVNGSEISVATMTIEGVAPQVAGVLDVVYGEEPTWAMTPMNGRLCGAWGSADFARKAVKQALSGRSTPADQSPAVKEALKLTDGKPHFVLLVDPLVSTAMGMRFAERLGMGPSAAAPPTRDPQYILISGGVAERRLTGELHVTAESVRPVVKLLLESQTSSAPAALPN